MTGGGSEVRSADMLPVLYAGCGVWVAVVVVAVVVVAVVGGGNGCRRGFGGGRGGGSGGDGSFGLWCLPDLSFFACDGCVGRGGGGGDGWEGRCRAFLFSRSLRLIRLRRLTFTLIFFPCLPTITLGMALWFVSFEAVYSV